MRYNSRDVAELKHCFDGTGNEQEVISPLFIKVANKLMPDLPILIYRIEKFDERIGAPFFMIPTFMINYLYSYKYDSAYNYEDKIVTFSTYEVKLD